MTLLAVINRARRVLSAALVAGCVLAGCTQQGATEENIAVEVAKVPGLGACSWSTGMTTTTDPVPVNFVTLPDGARAGRGNAETILRQSTDANTPDKTLKLIVGIFGAAAWQVLDRPRWRDLPTIRSSETRTAFI